MFSANASTKGEIRNEVVLFVITLIAIVLISYFIQGSAEVAGREAKIAECKKSVEAHATNKLFELKLNDDINCEPYTVEIEGGDSDRARRDVAKELITCWDMFGEGEYDLFNDDDVYCHPCSYLNIENDIPRLREYLATTTIPRDERTYLEYLKGISEEEVANVERLSREDIETIREYDFVLKADTTYAPILIYNRNEDHFGSLYQHYTGQTGGGRVALITGGVAGAGTGAAVGLALMGPPGWIVAGATVGTFIVVEIALDTWLREEKVEWKDGTYISLEVWDEKTADLLKQDLGCTVIVG